MTPDLAAAEIANPTNRGEHTRLQSVILTLQYCLETFEQNCQCGHCDPCIRGRQDIRQSIRDVEDFIHPQRLGSPANLAVLRGWDDKIADLFNHGLNDGEISDYFTADQACNFIRDYSALLRKKLQSEEDQPETMECSKVIDDLTCEERGDPKPCSSCRDRMNGKA